jgi:PhnB protein
MSLNAYLFFNGTCADAMRFYERTLGGKIEMMLTHAESPMADKTPPGSAETRHSSPTAGGGASDGMIIRTRPDWVSMSVSLSLIYPTVGDAKRVFNALAAGGQVTMPMEKTFWAEAFGMLVDRFGTPWMISGPMIEVV